MKNNCPKCSSDGISIAAMNYKETKYSETSGDISGVGVGGSGLMVGVGGYDSTTTKQSKRAAIFSEPKKFESPFLSTILVGFIVGLVMMNAPFLLSGMADVNFGSDAIAGSVVKIGMPILGVLVFVFLTVKAFIEQKESARMNKEVYPLFKNRYATLRYCEHCHIVFDENKNSEPATDEGFRKLLNISINKPLPPF